MFRLALAAVLSLGLACQGDECDASSLLHMSRDKDVPKKLPKGCTHGIKCENGSCRCAKPGEIERIREDMLKKAGKTATPATSQGAPKAAGDGCRGKSILCKTSKSEANCKFWKRVGCSWGQALLQKDTDFPTNCTHGIQCNEDGCRCANPGEVKQITEDIVKEVARAQPLANEEAPADDACMGEWFLCKSLETEESCKVFQSEGCAWGKAALLQKDMPKGCKNGITCRNGDCRHVCICVLWIFLEPLRQRAKHCNLRGNGNAQEGLRFPCQECLAGVQSLGKPRVQHHQRVRHVRAHRTFALSSRARSFAGNFQVVLGPRRPRASDH